MYVDGVLSQMDEHLSANGSEDSVFHSNVTFVKFFSNSSWMPSCTNG